MKSNIIIRVLLANILFIQISCIVSLAQSIKIGVSGPFSPPLDFYGVPALRATQLVAEQFNAFGGVNGETVEVIFEDDGCDPTQAATAANNLIAAGVHVVLGHICSGATASALALYDSANIVTMSPSATTPDLTYSGTYPLFFRTVPPDNIQAEIQVRYVSNVLGCTRFALVHDGTAYGKSLVDSAKNMIEASVKGMILYNAAITPGESTYSALIQEVMNFGAEVLLYGGTEPEAVVILNELRNEGSEIIFVSGEGVKSSSFIASTGGNAEGAILSSLPDFSDEYLAYDARQKYLDQSLMATQTPPLVAGSKSPT